MAPSGCEADWPGPADTELIEICHESNSFESRRSKPSTQLQNILLRVCSLMNRASCIEPCCKAGWPALSSIAAVTFLHRSVSDIPVSRPFHELTPPGVSFRNGHLFLDKAVSNGATATARGAERRDSMSLRSAAACGSAIAQRFPDNAPPTLPARAPRVTLFSAHAAGQAPSASTGIICTPTTHQDHRS